MNENRLGELKQAYDSIPIPEGLEFRVRSSIERAKQDLRKEFSQQNVKSKKSHKVWRNTAITAAAAMAAIVVLANSGAGMARAMERIPVLGTITRVVTFRTYENDQGNMKAHVDVPQVKGGSKELNQTIQDYTDTIIKQYEADVKSSDGQGNMNVDLSYQVVTDNDSLFALRFNKTVIMADGAEYVKIYNVDKATGKIINLSQLFQSGSDYAAPITDNIKEQMRQKMKADPDLTYWVDDSEVPEWDFKTVSQDTTFYLNGDNQLVIVFDEGEVSPMFMGVQEFVIPDAALSDIALPGYFG